MTDTAAAPPSLLRHRSFVLFWCARTSTSGAYQMQAVAVGWQLYDLTNDPLDLGLVGLMQFFPVVALALVIGQTADHFDRRVIAGTCQVVKAICAALFALGTIRGWLSRDAILLLILISGTARAFEVPTLHSIVPGIVPRSLLPRAIAASATAQQTAVICGPALGGFLYVLGPATVYLLCTAIFVVASILISFVQGQHRAAARKPVSVETLFAGFAYIRNNPVLLGAVSLDLFAVLLGGVTALLPIYARDILDTGPWGLGLLRSAPAVGALSMSVLLARHAIERRAGLLLLSTVCVFGLASTIFALSTSLELSFAALMVYGAADAINVVIRQSLVQTRTPHDMLGRVMSVNSMFSGSSGTLGEFRAGAMAAWIGAVPSALIGGLGVIVAALIWLRLFPALRRVERLTGEQVLDPDAQA
ncbi:MAG TPA: MFS transporter [Xanthobacteraceae bacterium]|nr:MFS transporter [Xanthobacteraceae bacterium]